MGKLIMPFKEEKVDLWSYYNKPEAKVFITISGSINESSHQLVMGRGCAKEAKDHIPDIGIVAGSAIFKSGLQVMFFNNSNLGIFPTKTQWYNKSDVTLIESSCKQLRNMADSQKWKSIILPRPGCGNGGLNWETQVKPILLKYFDERFTVVSK